MSAAPLALIAWTGVLASAFLTLSPSIVGGLVDGAGYDPASAGYIAVANLTGMIAGPLLMLASSRRIALRNWIKTAFALLAIGHLGSAATRAFEPMLALQLIAGVGAGIAYAATTVIGAATANPSATYGWMLSSQALFGLLAYLALPWIVGADSHGIARIFLLLGVLPALSLSLPVIVPARRGDAAAGSFPLGFSRPAALVCASLFLYYVANNGVYVYLDRIGAAAGFDLREVSIALGASTISSFVGGVLAGPASRRAAVTTWLVAGIVATALATTLLIDVRVYAVYVFAVCLNLAALVFTVSFLLAWLSTFDTGGRWVLFGNLSFSLGLAFGPALSARLIAPPSYANALITALGLYSMALVCAMLAALICGRAGAAPSQTDGSAG